MPYTVRLASKAADSLQNLQKTDRQRVQDRIDKLSLDPRPSGMEHVTGTDFLRVRAGDYRIIYLIDDQSAQLDVLKIAHRREAYRKLGRLP